MTMIRPYWWQYSAWATWTDEDLKEVRCWQKWCQLFIWKKKNMTPKELLELLSLEIHPSLGPEQFSLPQCPISPEVGGKQTGGRWSPCPQQRDQDEFLLLGWEELEMGIWYWLEHGTPYSLGRRRQWHVIHVRGRSISHTCNAQTDIDKDQAQSVCRQLILSLEQPPISHFELSLTIRSNKTQNWQPKQ